jgi:transcriptional regulator with XRE-family HTH domain
MTAAQGRTETVRRLTASRIRKIRHSLGFSREEFARALWASLKTVKNWESGYRSPAGAHRGLLILVERSLDRPAFRTALADPRAVDPMFLLYRILKAFYGSNFT